MILLILLLIRDVYYMQMTVKSIEEFQHVLILSYYNMI